MASSDENLASATPVPGEESNDNLPPEPSLAEIKGILKNSIQETVNNILGENQKLKEELKELKASSLSHDREFENLKKVLATATKCNDNLKVELESTKKLVHEQTKQIGNLQICMIIWNNIPGKTPLNCMAFPRARTSPPKKLF